MTSDFPLIDEPRKKEVDPTSPFFCCSNKLAIIIEEEKGKIEIGI